MRSEWTHVVDLCKDRKKALVLDEANPGLVAFANAWLPESIATKPESKLACMAKMCYYFVAQFNWHANDAEANVIAYDPKKHKPASDEVRDEVKQAYDVIGASFNEVATLLAATKVTVWQTNYHTGQTGYGGFSYKVAHEVFGNAASQFKDVHWAVGHTVSTRLLLHAFGIEGIRTEDLNIPAKMPRASHDISTELKACPAGCAKLFHVYEILRRACQSRFSVCLIRSPQDIKSICDSVQEVQRDPARYHIASYRLTGKPRLESYMPLEETIRIVSSFAHATMKSDFLSAMAESILPLNEMNREVEYKEIKELESALTRIKVEDAKNFLTKYGSNPLLHFAALAKVEAFHRSEPQSLPYF